MSKYWPLEEKDNKNPGYHTTEIVKGEYGELSKIQEELDEAKDAEKQNVKVMLLVELSDIIAATKGYLSKHFPDITIDDLEKMAEVTGRAHKNGYR